MKNQLLIRRFTELFDRVIVVDTYHWRKRPWIIIKILLVLLVNPKSKVILSASRNIRYLMKFLYYVPIHNNVYCWVVGGSHAQLIREGLYDIKSQKRMKKIIVQGRSMVKELNELGLENAVYVPNSKPINYTPNFVDASKKEIFRFVFLSRIHPDKGIKEIVEACEYLENKGYDGKFLLDFYGSFDTNYQKEFNELISKHPYIKYNGYLNFVTDKGYETLSNYDCMLFPTYWDGEGFPGVVLDANIAGVPIIATKWNLNSEVIIDGKTGVLIPIKDSIALATEMAKFIDGDYNILKFKQNCIEYVKQFDYREVISKELMLSLGLLS